MPLAVRLIDGADGAPLIPATSAMDAVMQRAYGATTFHKQLEWYATLQPDGLAVAEDDGEIVGAGCCIAYPEARFGWVGLVATSPGHERRGIGTAVTEQLIEVLHHHGCAPSLDASAAGAPVYERMGFADHGSTKVMLHDGSTAARPMPDGVTLTPSTGRDAPEWAEVLAFDRASFGADRSALLALVLRQSPGRAAIVRDSAGQVRGFVIAQHATIGPLLADDDRALDALLTFARQLPWIAAPRVCVPPESSHLRALHRLGWRTQRELRHMRHGIAELPGDGGRVAARISLGVG